jgi:hypothetical protein
MQDASVNMTAAKARSLEPASFCDDRLIVSLSRTSGEVEFCLSNTRIRRNCMIPLHKGR